MSVRSGNLFRLTKSRSVVTGTSQTLETAASHLSTTYASAVSNNNAGIDDVFDDYCGGFGRAPVVKQASTDGHYHVVLRAYVPPNCPTVRADLAVMIDRALDAVCVESGVDVLTRSWSTFRTASSVYMDAILRRTCPVTALLAGRQVLWDTDSGYAFPVVVLELGHEYHIVHQVANMGLESKCIAVPYKHELLEPSTEFTSVNALVRLRFIRMPSEVVRLLWLRRTSSKLLLNKNGPFVIRWCILPLCSMSYLVIERPANQRHTDRVTWAVNNFMRDVASMAHDLGRNILASTVLHTAANEHVVGSAIDNMCRSIKVMPWHALDCDTYVARNPWPGYLGIMFKVIGETYACGGGGSSRTPCPVHTVTRPTTSFCYYSKDVSAAQLETLQSEICALNATSEQYIFWGYFIWDGTVRSTLHTFPYHQ